MLLIYFGSGTGCRLIGFSCIIGTSGIFGAAGHGQTYLARSQTPCTVGCRSLPLSGHLGTALQLAWQEAHVNSKEKCSPIADYLLAFHNRRTDGEFVLS